MVIVSTKSLAPVLLLASLLVLGGCRSNKVSLADARCAFAAGDLESATETLQSLADGPRRTRQVSKLDLAMVELATGDVAAAESRLRELRDHFDTIPDSPGLDDAASLATDDNARVFQIAGYEQVLIRSLLAICSLAGDATDAEAYCLQAQKRQAELDRLAVNGTTLRLSDQTESDDPLEDTATAAGDASPPLQSPNLQQQVALAPYLQGTLREATHNHYDDAERSFRLVSRIVPDFAPAPADIERAKQGTHSRPDHGVLYVLAMVGHGPRLVESVAPTTTTSLQIASTLIRSAVKHEEGKDDEPVLPNIASVKVPIVEVPPSETAALGVAWDNQMLGATQTVTDVAQLAIGKVEAEMPWTIARAVARRVLKESSVAATSNSLGLSGDAAAAFEFAAINAWSASERADTRCWGLLPREFQVLRAELPVGTQTIELMPIAMSGEVIDQPKPFQLEIEDGRNHYVVVIAPERILSVIP